MIREKEIAEKKSIKFSNYLMKKELGKFPSKT
jgi:hypothetical protein